ncbi:MAG: S46 family peptidase [Cyclobacteriaceae bacterium]|nr:S46 family peptidase [Cyclobacteriaceae bacterium]
MKSIKVFVLIGLLFIRTLALADEGMWLPLLLAKLNEKEMRAMGMKISAEDIYSINKSSLKDAIVSFGGFCTGEVISSQGLLLTNHHCGFGAIQSHTTLQNNYIDNGFWAMSLKDELPNPNLFVTFIVRIEDVTSTVLNGVNGSMTESERQSQIDRNINIVRSAAKRETYQDILIRPFFEGNQYYLFVTETYRDVRLVGAPPSSIGNFGKDTDNWMWPRHTGDFSMFRIYADKNNMPAAYSPDNVPYKPKRSLSISLDGVSQNDFTMVFGFPGRTNLYLPSVAVEQLIEVNNPAKIKVRDQVLSVMDAYMRTDDQIKIQYAAKWASVSNAWKKWQGELLGLNRVDGVGRKKKLETDFQNRVNASPELKSKYGTVLSDLNKAYDELKPYGLARDYYIEITSRMELLVIASQLNMLVAAYDKDGESGYTTRLPQVQSRLNSFYGDYSPVVDQKMFEVLLTLYVNDQDEKFRSKLLNEKLKMYQGDFGKLSKALFAETDLDDKQHTLSLLDKPAKEVVESIRNNSIVQLFLDMQGAYQNQVQQNLNPIQDRINALQRTYMAAQMEVFKEKRFYPDANSTLRLTYGKVDGYIPRDGIRFDYYSYLDGVLEKYKPGDYEFDLPAKLIDLYKKKDYGQYGVNGKLPVNFIAANHTSGGNSGSPALDAWGNLVGLNFDRVWEGTMSDINYDPSICRNIMVDIRYILFIVDKYAGAGHLVKEMKLVHPKPSK